MTYPGHTVADFDGLGHVTYPGRTVADFDGLGVGSRDLPGTYCR